MTETDYDYIVIGSGFGGSVAAMRLAEKGYSVLVIEKGKWYRNEDFPKTNWSLRKYFWAPLFRCFGIQKLTFFKDVFILSGVGVGGGSLVYANTQMQPDDHFYQNPAWSSLKDWKSVLQPFYDKARFMLGTVRQPLFYKEDAVLKDIAKDMGREESFGNVNVGVYFGDPEKEVDPYFNGLGPLRKGCVHCAGCMVGCRHNAKNTLDKNYLWFAEKFGTKIEAETLAESVTFADGVYTVSTKSSTGIFNKNRRKFRSKGIVFAGGVLGTMELLLKEKFGTGNLSGISDMLGFNLRSNSESLCGIVLADEVLNHGVAISSIFNPDDNTHIEIVKYSTGSGVMGKLATLAVDGEQPFIRLAKWIGTLITSPIKLIRSTLDFEFASRSIILLVMQTLDNSMRMVWKKGLLGGSMTIDNSGNAKVPAYIGVGQDVMRRYAEKVNGIPMNAITEIVFNMSTTAHIIGGCPMGKTSAEGVVDENFKVHGYPNMLVMDGSIIPCNLGVNPSLTIVALSEYAMAQVPEKAGNTQRSLDDLMKS